MNPERLLLYFDRIADSPAAIPRLRRFILELAVRGKLVEHDPNDEPASELLKHIDAEKARLVRSGEIRMQGPASPVERKDQPFDVPENWAWVRFGRISKFSAGRTPSRHDFSFWNTGDYPWVSIADMNHGGIVVTTKETVSEKARHQLFRSEPLPVGTLIMSFKLTIGKISRLGVPAFHNEAIISMRLFVPELDPYLFTVLPMFSQEGNTKDAIKGATLNRDSIANILLPLPPLAEQHRIIAKVVELMGLCDRLESAQTERERRRDGLVAASLQRLNQTATATEPEQPNDFRDHAAFYFNHLPSLTTRHVHIKQLRQTILNLAVRGNLVPQDPNEEPASELLKRILAEKARLEKGGRIRRQTHRLTTNQNELPFEVPSTWRWVRLGDLATLIGGYAYSSDSYVRQSSNQLIRLGNVKNDSLLLDQRPVFIPDLIAQDTAEFLIQPGDILITMTGTKAKRDYAFTAIVKATYVADNRLFLNQRVGAIRPHQADLVPLINIFLKAESLLDIIFLTATGTVNQGNIGSGAVLRWPIPLPPLAEQHRIVAKVDELMALCDQLEAQLTATKDDSRRLLEAVLHEALHQPDKKEV